MRGPLTSSLLASLLVTLTSCANTTGQHEIGELAYQKTWDDGSTSVFQSVSPGSTLGVQVEGEVDLGEDGSDLRLLTADSSLVVREQEVGELERVLKASRAADGTTVIYYRENDVEVEFGEAPRAWLAGIVAELHRKTALGAGPRAERLLTSGEWDALLSAAEQTQCSDAAAVYLEAGLSAVGLQPAFATRIVDAVGAAAVGSSSSRHLLERAVGLAPEDEGLTRAILQAAARLTDTPTQEGVLTLASNRVSSATMADYYDAVAAIRSEPVRERVLIASLDSPLPTPALSPGYLKACSDMTAALCRSQALGALWKRGSLDEAGRLAWVASASQITSSNYEGELLAQFFLSCPEDDAALCAALQSTGALSNSPIQKKCIEAFFSRPQHNKEQLRAAAEAIKTIPASMTRSELQSQLIELQFGL